MSRKWEFLIGDINWQAHGGSWCRHVANRHYHVVELINLRDAMGEEAEVTYSVSLKSVNLDEVPRAGLDAAISCMGLNDATFARLFEGDDADIGYVEALASFGLFAPMGDWDGNAYRPLIAAAKRESNRLISDREYVESQMSRPINRLGSTAKEYATGDTQSALIRGIAKGDKMAYIIGKIQGLKTEEMDSIGPEYADFTLTPNG